MELHIPPQVEVRGQRQPGLGVEFHFPGVPAFPVEDVDPDLLPVHVHGLEQPQLPPPHPCREQDHQDGNPSAASQGIGGKLVQELFATFIGHERLGDLLILDDLGLHRLTGQQSADLYELIVSRHRVSSFVIASNRAMGEWLSLFDDPIPGNSALDRLANSSYQIVMGVPQTPKDTMSVTVVEGERDTDRCVGHRAGGGGFWCDIPVARVVWSLRRGGFPVVLETVAVAVHLQDVDMVGKTVQQRSGQAFLPEDLGPLVEGQVGGHQDGAPLVALAEDLEERFRPGGGQGDEAQLIDGQQVEQPSFVPGPQRSVYLVFTGADAPARFPSQGGCLGLLRGYDHLERGRWNVAQSVLVDVDALDDVAVLGAVHDLVLRVLGLVQRQSQLFHCFHLLVVIDGGKVYQVSREL